ncbi:MAG: hypothetical protein ACFCUV_00665 [Rivularia sp. (in: cyanobacteria)]
MTISTAVTDQIKTLNDLQTRCNLYQAEDGNFFTEWLENLPQLNETEKAGVARIKLRLILFTSAWRSPISLNKL